MKTVTINLYSFDELSKIAQEKALKELSDVNVDHYWWDPIYDDFYQMCQYFGIDVDLKKTFFTGFYHQGQGSAFTASIDIQKLVKCVKDQKWKEYAPREKFFFPEVTTNIQRVCKLIDAGKIDFSMWVSPSNRGTSISIENESSVSDNGKIVEPIQIFTALDDLTYLVESVCKRLNAWFFKMLQDACDYLQSREAIIETIEANNWTFRENGKMENL